MAMGMVTEDDTLAPLRSGAVSNYWGAQRAGQIGFPPTAPQYAKRVLGSTLGYDPTQQLAQDAKAWEARRQGALQAAYSRVQGAALPGGQAPNAADFAKRFLAEYQE